MGERLSWDEIKQRYPDEWVCLVDVERPNMGHVVSGVVHSHDPKHAGLLVKQRGLQEAAILWTGKIRGRVYVMEADVDRKV